MAKSRGSKLEFSRERLSALMQEYDRYIDSCDHIEMSAVFEHIVNQPCRRFWVSSKRARVVIARMLKGGKLSGMRPSKLEMFQEIFRRVCILKERNPSLTLFQLVEEVVSRPAPKFYISPGSAKIFFYKAKKEWYLRKKRRLRLC